MPRPTGGLRAPRSAGVTRLVGVSQADRRHPGPPLSSEQSRTVELNEPPGLEGDGRWLEERAGVANPERFQPLDSVLWLERPRLRKLCVELVRQSLQPPEHPSMMLHRRPQLGLVRPAR